MAVLSTVFQMAILVTFIFLRVQGHRTLVHWSLNGAEQGLTLHGGPTFVEGRYPGSKAINFNQTSNCFARIPKVELRGRSFTIALWVKMKIILDRDQTVFGDWYHPWQFRFQVERQGSRINFGRHGLSQLWFGYISNKGVQVNQWQHVSVTWDQAGGVTRLFIDAEEVSTKMFNINERWYGPTRDTYEIGDDGHSDEHQFLGSVMDLYIIDGVLNSDEINHLRGSPEITSSYLNNTFVYVNESVKCQATGSPTPYVAWVRSGVILDNKTSSAEVTITEDNGEYICIASNQEGEEKLSVKTKKAALRLCHDYSIISDASRDVNHIQSSPVKNDSKDIDLSKWYRIQSPAGNQLPTTCVPQNRCGTQAPGWLNGEHPGIQDGIVKRTVCFQLNGDCCYQNTTVHIRRCSGYYVYKFSGIPEGLPGRYCIGKQQHHNQDHPDTVFEAPDGIGFSLVGHVMYTEGDVPDVFTCMDYCQLYDGCKSFNFDREKKNCELNNGSRREYPDAFQKRSFFIYYQKASFFTFAGRREG